MLFKSARVFPLLFILFSCASTDLAQTSPNQPASPPPAAAEYNPKAWKEFSSPEGRFSVSMVGTPKFLTQDVETVAGKVTLNIYLADSGAGTYYVLYVDMPFLPEDATAIKAALDGARDEELSEKKNRKLVAENEITVEGHPVRELFVGEGGRLIREWIFAVRQRLYQVTLVTAMNLAFKTGLSSNNPDDWTDLYRSMGEKFFGSFKLLPATPSGGAVMSAPYGDPITHSAGDAEPKAQVSGGILNGRALKMTTPVYPPVAKAAAVSGEVSVRVVFDESGRVIWAKAISGHEYLRAAAEEAARQATFTPMRVQGKPVRVSGILLYKFSR